MLTPVPNGYERFPLLFNPIRVPAARRGRGNPTLVEAHPVLPVLPLNNDDRPVKDGALEKLFKLTVETRRNLLMLDAAEQAERH